MRQQLLARFPYPGTLAGVRRFDEAITAQQDAVAIYRVAGDRHREGMTLNNLGPALQGAGRFEEFITALKDAAAIYRETVDRHGEGGARTNLGLALCRIGRSEEAITPFKDAAAIFREAGDLRREGHGADRPRLGAERGGVVRRRDYRMPGRRSYLPSNRRPGWRRHGATEPRCSQGCTTEPRLMDGSAALLAVPPQTE
jgi:tetratricopeptide (TPR) repeat protein